MSMRTIQIGKVDTMGTRFNGQDLHLRLLERGIVSEHCVWDKLGDDPLTWQMVNGKLGRKIYKKFWKLERALSIQSVLFPSAISLYSRRGFRKADIAHYHLIHTGFFSVASLPLLTRYKPSVWTLHDPWALTGHCIYPFDCERWKTGCGECPNMDVPLIMRKDRTALMWKIKEAAYRHSRMEVVVASRWMKNLVDASPLFSGIRSHYIPFGIDLDVFRPGDADAAKAQLGVSPGNSVVFLRGLNTAFKGLGYAIDALKRLDLAQDVTVISVDHSSRLDELGDRFQIINLGWTDDVKKTVHAYNAADLFLMPSLAEAFGLMAIEAMACGKPVITFDGTSLPEVIKEPHGGISVPMKDSAALAAALGDLLENPEKRESLGIRAREIAVQEYCVNLHVDRIVNLYEDAIERHKTHSVRQAT